MSNNKLVWINAEGPYAKKRFHEEYTNKKQQQPKSKKAKKEYKCYICRETGHYVRDCPNKEDNYFTEKREKMLDDEQIEIEEAVRETVICIQTVVPVKIIAKIVNNRIKEEDAIGTSFNFEHHQEFRKDKWLMIKTEEDNRIRITGKNVILGIALRDQENRADFKTDLHTLWTEMYIYGGRQSVLTRPDVQLIFAHNRIEDIVFDIASQSINTINSRSRENRGKNKRSIRSS